MSPKPLFFALFLFLSLLRANLGDFPITFETADTLPLNTLVSDTLSTARLQGNWIAGYLVVKLLIGRSYRVIFIPPATGANRKELWLYNSNQGYFGYFTSGASFSLVPTSTENIYFVVWQYGTDPYGTYSVAVIDETACSASCRDCRMVTSICSTCVTGSQCNLCSNVPASFPYTYGGSCFCDSGQYFSSETCIPCSTLDGNCTKCSDANTCKACSGGLLVYGKTCVTECPPASFHNNGVCISCTALDSYCIKCSDNVSCLGCSGGKAAYGASCYDSCPFGTKNTNGICVVIPLTITLVNTEEANIYLVQFSSPLTIDIQVPTVSKIILVGVAASVYSITMTKQTDTVYKISIEYFQTIPSATLRVVYTLNGSPATTNVLRGEWTADITSKYLAYMSEGTKEAVEAVNKVTGGSMQGAATGAGSMAILGGNPALLWPLLNLFQAFYYLIFIDVNYPANVQMFLKIFSMGSLSFIQNPLDWFVGDIDAYDLPVPKRYNDYNFSGLFLNNSGNELLLAF